MSDETTTKPAVKAEETPKPDPKAAAKGPSTDPQLAQAKPTVPSKPVKQTTVLMHRFSDGSWKVEQQGEHLLTPKDFNIMQRVLQIFRRQKRAEHAKAYRRRIREKRQKVEERQKEQKNG